jgi:CubicO group peptidase (beta-lactamase class C family)
MRTFLMVAGVMGCLAAVAPAAARDGTDLSAGLAATLEDFHARHGFPGFTAAVALPDGTLVAAATGLADVEFGRRMTPETPMLAASIGKTFVAATVLALESEGRLSQGDRLAHHLGDRPWFSGLPNADSITIGHLLRHRAGLPDHVHLPAFQTAWAHIAAGEAMFSPEELVGFVAGQEPLFEAGSGWAYSDTGYILLGLVIEAVTGRAYHEIVRERFLGPLALTGTFPSDRRDLPGLAVGYTAPEIPTACRPAPLMPTAGCSGIRRWNGPAAGGRRHRTTSRVGGTFCSVVRRSLAPTSIGCSMGPRLRRMCPASSTGPASRSTPIPRAARSTATAAGSRGMSQACATMPTMASPSRSRSTRMRAFSTT